MPHTPTQKSLSVKSKNGGDHDRRRAVASLTVPGGQEFHFPHFFLKSRLSFLIFPQTFTHFFPQFSPPGGRLAHPERPWLHHWTDSILRLLQVLSLVNLGSWGNPWGTLIYQGDVQVPPITSDRGSFCDRGNQKNSGGSFGDKLWGLSVRV